MPEIPSAGHGMALCLAEELRAERDCHEFVTVTNSLFRRKFQRHMKLRLLKRARLSLSHCLRRQPAAIRKPALKKCRRPKDSVHALGQVMDFLGPCRARQELHRSATTADNPHASVLFGESGFERVSSVLCWLGLMSHGGPWVEFDSRWRVAACIKGSGDAHLEPGLTGFQMHGIGNPIPDAHQS